MMLIQISNGQWVDPDEVVTVYAEAETTFNCAGVRMVLFTAGVSLWIPCESLEQAKAFRDDCAKRINCSRRECR